jgi:hypothetical protein
MPADGDRLARVWPALDFGALVASAARHGVSALVADFLAAQHRELPPAEQQALQRDARGLISRGLRIRKLTLSVFDALRTAGLEPVLLKGAGLAQRLYPEQPLARPSSDVDVWVVPEELPTVASVLPGLGFSRGPPEAHGHHESWVANGALVEVHFRVFSGFGGNAFDDAALRSRLVAGDFFGRAVRWLHPDDEFVYLATHAANHGFLRASWLVDLQRALARRDTFDWAAMAARCRAAGFHAAVSAALLVLREALHVTLPFAAERHFSSGRLRALGTSRLFSAERLERAHLSESRVASVASRFWLMDSPRDGVTEAVGGARRLLKRYLSLKA